VPILVIVGEKEMAGWAEELIESVLEEEKKEKRERREKREGEVEKREGEILRNIEIRYLENNAIFLRFEIKSKSQEGLYHKTRLILQNGEERAKSCDCKGWEFHHKCWHVTYALNWARKHGFMS